MRALRADLAATAAKFDPLLAAYVHQHILDVTLRERVTYALRQSGLRERPHLVRIGACLMDDDFEPYVPIAIAAEALITAQLVTDDMLDDADTRWGLPSVATAWGPGFASLAADLLQTLAFRSLAALRSPVLIRAFLAHQARFHAWQARQSLLEGTVAIDQSEYERLAFWRTGYLLYLSLISPMLLLGVAPAQRLRLRAFGRHFGIAFQLRDDVIDFVADPHVAGKPLLGDLARRQPNHVLICHCKRLLAAGHSHVVHDPILAYLQRRGSLPDVNVVLRLVSESGALHESFRRIEEHTDRAGQALTENSSLAAATGVRMLRRLLAALRDLPVRFS